MWVDVCFLLSAQHLKHHTGVVGSSCSDTLQMILNENRVTEGTVWFYHKTTVEALGGLGLTVTDFRVMPWKVPMVSILKLSVSKEETEQRKQQVAGYQRLLDLHHQK